MFFDATRMIVKQRNHIPLLSAPGQAHQASCRGATFSTWIRLTLPPSAHMPSRNSHNKTFNKEEGVG